MENAPPNSSSMYRGSKRNVLLAMVVFTVAANFAAQWFETNPSFNQIVTFFTAIGYGFLILLWCSLDSRERNENLGQGFRILLIVFGALALLFYLFKSRGFKKGLVSTGYALLFFLGLVIVGSITIIIFRAFVRT